MNNSKNTCCVYCHTLRFDGRKYIGMTVYGNNPNRRWQNGNKYEGTYFGSAIKKYGWDNFEHEIIQNNLSLEEARKLEKKLIKDLGTQDSTKGFNLSAGGDGCYDFSMTTREKMSKAKKGSAPWNKGKHPRLHEVYYGFDPSVAVVCLEDGKTFYNQSAAARYYNIDRSLIGKSINQHRTLKNGLSFCRYNNITESRLPKTTAVRVLCVETNIIYNSMQEIEDTLGISHKNVSAACRGKRHTAGGYHWQYVNKI